MTLTQFKAQLSDLDLLLSDLDLFRLILILIDLYLETYSYTHRLILRDLYLET